MEKIVSFIIPAYNSEAFLDKYIPSFLVEEVLDKLEIIIVNDGSTDRTEEIAKKYAAKYPKSVFVITQENKGHGGAINTGCAAAAGKYLKVIDADDWVESDNLAKYVEKLEKSESEVILTHFYTVDISTKEKKEWKMQAKTYEKVYSMEQIMDNWLDFNRCLCFHGITYRRDFYLKNAIRLSEHVFYEDNEFATIPCCYAKTIEPLDLFLYDYRVGDVNQSVSEVNQLKRITHLETVLRRLSREHRFLWLSPKSGGYRYYMMKTKWLLISYVIVAALIEPDKRKGRRMARRMMQNITHSMPQAYDMAKNGCRILLLMSYFGISKQKGKWLYEKILYSPIVRGLRHIWKKGKSFVSNLSTSH